MFFHLPFFSCCLMFSNIVKITRQRGNSFENKLLSASFALAESLSLFHLCYRCCCCCCCFCLFHVQFSHPSFQTPVLRQRTEDLLSENKILDGKSSGRTYWILIELRGIEKQIKVDPH